MRRMTALVAFFIFAGMAVPALAAPDYKAAKAAFQAGQKFLKEKKYGEAIVEFKKAHKITGDDIVLGQIARAYEKAGDYEAALVSMKQYRKALSRSERRSADRLIRRYKRKIRAGKSKPLTLPAPPKPKPKPKPKPIAKPILPPKPKPKAVEPEPEQPRRRLWTWVALGTGGALAISALVVGLSAQSSFDELEDRCGPAAGGTCPQSDIDSVKTRAVAADVLWGVAAAATVTATVLFFLEGRSSSSSSESDDDDDDDDDDEEDDGLVGSLRVAPLVGGGTYGLGASFRY